MDINKYTYQIFHHLDFTFIMDHTNILSFNKKEFLEGEAKKKFAAAPFLKTQAQVEKQTIYFEWPYMKQTGYIHFVLS